MTHIDEHFSFGRIAAPKQWHDVDQNLIADTDPVQSVNYSSKETHQLHDLIQYIRACTYTPDRGKDIWKSNNQGDCEDKCLYLIESYINMELFNSLRLAICEQANSQQHAVLLLYTEEGTKVIDPTLSTMAVPWEKYPVNKWIIRHRNGFLWENFKERV